MSRRTSPIVPPAPAPVVLPAVGLHGMMVTQFDGNHEEWSEYSERLEHYFTANDITAEEKKRAILLNAVGPTTYCLLKTLASPEKLTDLSFLEIVTCAKRHFNPKPSPIVKRYEFNTRWQREGETVASFVAELRKIAENCEYGDALSENVMRSCGMWNSRQAPAASSFARG